MATGAKPALDPTLDTTLVDNTHQAVEATPDARPLTLKDRIVNKLTAIFAHNEDLGVTRP